jgi:hypothetical protein
MKISKTRSIVSRRLVIAFEIVLRQRGDHPARLGLWYAATSQAEQRRNHELAAVGAWQDLVARGS